MLNIDKEVAHGILFMRIDGKVNNKNFNQLGKEINYLLYIQGIQYFVLDFKEIEDNTYLNIQNKLVEIFLNCGRVALCGMSDVNKKKIGYTKDKLYYVNKESEAFKYLWM